jgi:hypothetical protein
VTFVISILRSIVLSLRSEHQADPLSETDQLSVYYLEYILRSSLTLFSAMPRKAA